jgi:excisionase family DNA binding protein
MSDWTNKRRVWSVSQIAAEFSCATSTVRLWCETGALTAAKVGKLWKVRAEDLARFVHGQQSAAA